MATLGRVWLLAMVGLVLSVSLAQASAPTVTVTLAGPNEGWYDDDLTFSASGSFSLDGDTQEEIRDGEASVSDEYSWSYSPAALVSGGGAHDSCVTVRYSQQQAGQTYTVSVSYTVTVTYKDGTSDSGSATASKDVFIKKLTVTLEPDQTHDYIVPGCTLNTIHYTLSPKDASAVLTSSEVLVKSKDGSAVRTLSASTNGGTNQLQWNGLDDAGRALTEDGSPYTYVLRVRDKSNHEFTDEIGGRLIKEWIVSIIVRDRSVPSAEYESGVDEETIADSDGNPKSMTVSVSLPGGGFDVAKYSVTPNTGPNGWDADVSLQDEDSAACLFYTTPNPEIPPVIQYQLTLSQAQPFVKDECGNAWDTDPEQDGQQTSAKWTFGITPDGELENWEEEYH
ncbi:MAG: hypothetical protein ACYC63_10885 [Armatimonadota bacterium]